MRARDDNDPRLTEDAGRFGEGAPGSSFDTGFDDSFGSGTGGSDYGYSDYGDWFGDFETWEVEDAVLDVFEDVYGWPEGEQMFEDLVYDPGFSMDAYFDDLVSEFEGWYFEDDWLSSPYGSYGSYDQYGDPFQVADAPSPYADPFADPLGVDFGLGSGAEVGQVVEPDPAIGDLSAPGTSGFDDAFG